VEVVMFKIENKVVARFRDGSMVKGITYDFNPSTDIFHITKTGEGNEILEVSVSQLKAVFFVKSFEGSQDYECRAFTKESLRHIPGLKLKVAFEDGEVIYGTTTGYTPARKAFFLLPADKESNNQRLYVIRESTSKVETWT
jgi:hypothetical protein